MKCFLQLFDSRSYCESADKMSGREWALILLVGGRTSCPLRGKAEFLPAAEGLILSKCLVQSVVTEYETQDSPFLKISQPSAEGRGVVALKIFLSLDNRGPSKCYVLGLFVALSEYVNENETPEVIN